MTSSRRAARDASPDADPAAARHSAQRRALSGALMAVVNGATSPRVWLVVLILLASSRGLALLLRRTTGRTRLASAASSTLVVTVALLLLMPSFRQRTVEEPFAVAAVDAAVTPSPPAAAPPAAPAAALADAPASATPPPAARRCTRSTVAGSCALTTWTSKGHPARTSTWSRAVPGSPKRALRSGRSRPSGGPSAMPCRRRWTWPPTGQCCCGAGPTTPPSPRPTTDRQDRAQTRTTEARRSSGPARVKATRVRGVGVALRAVQRPRTDGGQPGPRGRPAKHRGHGPHSCHGRRPSRSAAPRAAAAPAGGRRRRQRPGHRLRAPATPPRRPTIDSICAT
jgi:hypothetical protein